jgi:hypothetical protein
MADAQAADPRRLDHVTSIEHGQPDIAGNDEICRAFASNTIDGGGTECGRHGRNQEMIRHPRRK